jgi:RimJ/RimL family protein N-acetyltransferase
LSGTAANVNADGGRSADQPMPDGDRCPMYEPHVILNAIQRELALQFHSACAFRRKGIVIIMENTAMLPKHAIATDRLSLRPLAPDDFCAVHLWASNPENTRYMPWGPNSAKETKEFLASAVTPGKDFAVVLKDTGAVIGSCGIYPDKANDNAELGWILHKDYWKRGYGTELGGALIRYGFEDLKLRRIFAFCAAANYGSCRVMERNGMSREALSRKSFWARVDKEWIDGAAYAILADDYFTKKRSGAFWTKSDKLILEREITFRQARRDDAPSIFHFILELAEYESLLHQVSASVELLEDWLFEKHAAEAIIVEAEGSGVGFALYFSNFSTFLGKAGLYLEDLYIQPQYRGHGIGKALLKELAKIAAERGYGRMEWSCLDWNQPSIDFYRSLGAEAMSDWTAYRLSEEKLKSLAKGQ